MQRLFNVYSPSIAETMREKENQALKKFQSNNNVIRSEIFEETNFSFYFIVSM